MKNKSAVILLLSANAVSGFAQGISMLAIPWYFINMLKEAPIYNTVFIAVTFLTLFWSPYAGTLIDRYPRKNIFMALCMVGMTILGSVAFYGFQHESLPIALIILVFGFTVLNYNLHYPALYALSQELTERSNYGKVNSMLEIQGQATSMLSGACAAILLSGFDLQSFQLSWIPESWELVIQPWALYEIFLLDAGTYLIAIVLIFFIRYQPTTDLKIDTGSLKSRFSKGIQFLKKNPLLFYFGNLTYAIFIIVIVHGFYLIHIYISDYLESEGAILAIAEVFFTVGALTAGIGVRRLFRNVPITKSILILMGVTVLSLLTLGLTQSFIIVFFISILMGFANSGTRILRITYLFEHIPNNTIGRAGSIFQAFNILMRMLLLGLFSLAFFIENVEHAYIVQAVLILLAMIPLLVHYKKIVNIKVKE